jgi:hypothetical protein
MQKRTFESSMRKFYGMALPMLVIAGALAYYGLTQYKIMKYDDGSFPPGWLFYLLPWGVSGLLVLGLLVLFLESHGRKVVLTPKNLECLKGEEAIFKVSYNNLSFTPPRQDQKRFRSALLSDGRNFMRIDEFFWPDFDLMVEVILEARKSSRSELSTGK